MYSLEAIATRIKTAPSLITLQDGSISRDTSLSFKYFTLRNIYFFTYGLEMPFTVYVLSPLAGLHVTSVRPISEYPVYPPDSARVRVLANASTPRIYLTCEAWLDSPDTRDVFTDVQL